MQLDKPLIPNQWAGFFIRVPMGLYFFLSGRLLLQDIEGLIEAVKTFGVVGSELSYLYAVCLPWLQLLVGVLLVGGFLTTLASIIAAFLLLTFIYAFGIYPDQTIPFNKDLIWLGASLALLSIGPGAFSIDGFRNKG